MQELFAFTFKQSPRRDAGPGLNDVGDLSWANLFGDHRIFRCGSGLDVG